MFSKNRILSSVLVLTMCTGLFAGCGSDHESTAAVENQGETEAVASVGRDEINTVSVANDTTYSVVCTIFPEYDWAREVIGDLSENYEMTLLLDNGVDLHNYQPTADDIAKIAECDLFIYVGGESDGWVEDALKEATNENMQVINLLDVLGDTIKEEELVEGMQESDHDHEHDEAAHEEKHEEEHDEAAHEEEHGEEEPEYDEHVWLSLRNAQTLVSAISDALKVIDSENADVYQANCDAYNAELAALDAEYESVVAQATQSTLVFADRFPFRYMVDDYNLDYYAAFVGCSAETEASFETVVFLAGKMDELNLNHVLVIESSDQKIAQTVIGNTQNKNQDILVLNSLQAVTSEEIEQGVTYLSIMQDNLEVLTEALD